jgi:neutral trehalase
MFSQKLRHVEDDELRIDIDPCYEADPYELKLDEMIDAEPEPEVIEGLPASDALTPADRYLELFTNVQKSRIFADSKTFPTARRSTIRWTSCGTTARSNVSPISICGSSLKTTSGCRRARPTFTSPTPT